MSLTAHLVVRTGMRAYSLDYRLAPSTPSRQDWRMPWPPIVTCSTRS